MALTIKFANIEDRDLLVDFFSKHLEKDNDGIYSEEFTCPYGIKRAINRNQIVIAKDDKQIIGALRFYPQKKKDITSLYQFAIIKNRRGKELLKTMLRETKNKTIQSRCKKEAKFNEYYKKTGRKLIKTDKHGNLRQLEL
ncbi:MAG TPA: hypothetical protein P5060_01350 [Candidatus Absconditabacterales bacterium]|nr:hypothetical protein [Candidatus Absconditabacterales bacterium]